MTDRPAIQVIPDDLLALADPEEVAAYRSYLAQEAGQGDMGYEAWLIGMFPAFASSPLAEHHRALWAWFWELTPGHRPHPMVGILGRGGAKSTTAELGAIAAGFRRARKYALYVSETQEQADDHVANIAGALESPELERAAPDLCERMVSKYGNSKGWRRNRLRTASGFTVDAIGLDTAARGIKIEEARPDLMILDDIDGEHDTSNTVEKKIRTLTRKILPAGSTDCAVIAIQNLVHDQSIFARLAGTADEPADFLYGRTVIGPIPAVEDLEITMGAEGPVIMGGEATWEGFDLVACQGLLEEIGETAFLAECQHETTERPGGMFSHLDWPSIRITEAELPELTRTTVWVDPAVTSTDSSDSMGIQCDGLGADGLFYRLWSWEAVTTPLDAITRAIRKAAEWNADTVGVETDQGGDTWEVVFRQALTELTAAGLEFDGPPPRFKQEKAGAGHGPKAARAALMLVDYERRRFRHLEGTHPTLEGALFRFPKTKPYDLTDACYWGWRDLGGGKKPRSKAKASSAAKRSIGNVQTR